jgi:hypothetical protein
MRIKYVVIFVLLFILLLIISGGFFYKLKEMDFIVVTAFCGALFVEACMLISARFAVDRAYRSDPFLKYQQTYIINEKGIEIKSERGNKIVKWDDFTDMNEYNDMFIFTVSKSNAVVIPRRFFEDENDIIVFKEIVENNVGSKTKVDLG